MTHQEAVAALDVELSHAWMVRTFLKHADEAQDDEEILDVHRTLFDVCRAVEPARQRGDAKEYVHRLRGKLAKLRRAAAFFAANYQRVTDHTNWQMAAASLTGCVARIEAILDQVPKGSDASVQP